ncbi:hypothetical protein GCM10012287_16800 [Streptomyces daqingensis]|uniref:DUF2399 domain-containing protein n=1 Tax=Streptomyces daqingensis TaxID=1472640 RepID=A0ABQ2M369_9ACTN|nr:hypothetical protein [Streptomyces daqingensis]GGO46444.1 hypothetical protein GCM10012287_16800 [Streptomyces daqingensis]
MTNTVSGRSYKRTRVRGFADWTPRPHVQHLVDQVLHVLDENRAYLPMTARQVFYRLVGGHGYDKTEQAYSRLLETLNRARRARMIPMHAIRDDGGTEIGAGGWDSPDQFWRAIENSARGYRHSPEDGQPIAVELWVEAAGMVPMVARVANEYGVTAYSSGGFDSVTVKHSAAQRISWRDVPTTVLHLGDHDPSGLSILDSAAEDISAFVADMGGEPPTFARLGVTEEQIARYRLPSAPQKATDRRGEHMRHTVQAEAMSPTQLTQEVRDALEEVVDLGTLHEMRELSEQEREEILARIPSAED